MYGIVNVGGGYSSPSAPTLTALSPVGTVVGTSSWTGTGEFNTSSSANNSKKFNRNLLRSATSQTFYRINLKLADGEDWRNWSAYYDHGGNEYEFYYSPVRGVYDGLVPDESLTLQKVIDKVRWVYGRKPTVIYYGKVDRLLKYNYSSGDSKPKSVRFSTYLEDYEAVGTGKYSTATDYENCNVGDIQVYMNFMMWDMENEADLKKVPLPLLAKAEIVLDTEGTGQVSTHNTSSILQEVSGSGGITINTIDNWEV